MIYDEAFESECFVADCALAVVAVPQIVKFLESKSVISCSTAKLNFLPVFIFLFFLSSMRVGSSTFSCSKISTCSAVCIECFHPGSFSKLIGWFFGFAKRANFVLKACRFCLFVECWSSTEVSRKSSNAYTYFSSCSRKGAMLSYE